MAINQSTLAAAKAYTDAELQDHEQAADPHPQYLEMVYPDGNPTAGSLILLRTSDTTLPPVAAGSVVFAPGPTPARGVYMPNEAASAWVQIGSGPIPVDTTAPSIPGNFRVTGTSTTRIDVAWNASTDSETGVAGYDVSIDGGSWASLTNVLAYSFINLQPSSTHTLRVRARDNATTPNVSAAASVNATTSAAPVTVPQNLRVTATTTTSLTFAWDAPPSGTVSRYEWRLAGGTFATNGTATTKPLTGLTQNTSYTFGVRAVFADNTTSSEVTLAARTASTNPSPVTTLTGVSHSAGSNHGGYGDNWPAWRVYNNSTLNTGAARNPQPKILAYSASPTPPTAAYTTTFNNIKAELDNFYYGGSGQTKSVRFPIKVYRTIGNENYTAAKIGTLSVYIETMRAQYDACHYIDPATGQRRFPNAYSCSNPTTYQEQSGIVQTALHATARYHDCVIWSMYPTKLGDAGEEVPFTWPSLKESDRTNSDLGYLIRVFYRTKQAEAQGRIDRGDPTFRLQIGAGEGGATYSPSDSTERPYWAAHAWWGGAMKLAAQYDLDMPFLLWWDGGSGAYGEKVVAGRATNFVDEPSSTNPSTAQVWHDPQLYNHEFGGTHPASWAGNPKAGWKPIGPVV